MPIITAPKNINSPPDNKDQQQNKKNNHMDFQLSEPRYQLSDIVANNSTLAEIESLISLNTFSELWDFQKHINIQTNLL